MLLRAYAKITPFNVANIFIESAEGDENVSVIDE